MYLMAQIMFHQYPTSDSIHGSLPLGSTGDPKLMEGLALDLEGLDYYGADCSLQSLKDATKNNNYISK